MKLTIHLPPISLTFQGSFWFNATFATVSFVAMVYSAELWPHDLWITYLNMASFALNLGAAAWAFISYTKAQRGY